MAQEENETPRDNCHEASVCWRQNKGLKERSGDFQSRLMLMKAFIVRGMPMKKTAIPVKVSKLAAGLSPAIGLPVSPKMMAIRQQRRDRIPASGEKVETGFFKEFILFLCFIH